MDWEQIRYFIARPWWQQHCLLFSLPCLLFMLMYYLIIYEVSNNIELQQQVLVETNQQIKLIELKIVNYPSQVELEQEMTQLQQQNVIFTQKQLEDLLTEQIQHSKLTLRFFQHQQQDHASFWQIELGGSYQQFMAFLQTAIIQRVPWGIQNMQVRKESDQLVFLLSVFYRQSA